MKTMLLLGSLLCLAIVAWWVGSLLSPSAARMAVGILFGMIAFVPSAMMFWRRNNVEDWR